MTRSLIVYPSKKLAGTVTVPGDKSISHRAVLLGSVAEGQTEIVNLLEAEDVLATIDAMRALGIKIKRIENRKWKIEGGDLKSPKRILNCGNSGTTLRLLTGLLAGFPITATLTGDASLNRRPMRRVIEPLRKMGAKIHETRNRKGRFITVTGGPLRGGNFRLPAASAQLKSALLLAGLNAGQPLIVTEPARSRDHSERMLKAFGASLIVRGKRIILRPGRPLLGRSLVIPADISSALFFLVAALISPDKRGRVVLKNVGINPTRFGAIEILRRMGGKINVRHRRTVCGEPVADLVVQSSGLKGTIISGTIIPRLIDEIPALAVAAACASGKTIIRDAGELRIKETDRIHALAVELPKFGIQTKELKDGIEIIGVGLARKPFGATASSYGDHRIAMSLAILGTVSNGITTIKDTDCIATSFPAFVPLLRRVGGRLIQKTL